MTTTAPPTRPLVDLGRPLVTPVGGAAAPAAAGPVRAPESARLPVLRAVVPEPRTPEPEWLDLEPLALEPLALEPLALEPLDLEQLDPDLPDLEQSSPRHARSRRPRGGRRRHLARTARAARRVTEHLLTLVVLMSVLLFVTLVLGPRTGAYQTTTMLTGSMAPALPAGSLLVDRPVPVADVQPGDVVTFEAPVSGRPVVSHRVVAVEVSGGRTALRTKGDANASVDPWLAVPEDTVWVVQAAIPGAGTAIRWLRSPGPRSGLVVGVPAVLLLWGLLLVWRDPDEEPEVGRA